jgi:hypothetical protein
VKIWVRRSNHFHHIIENQDTAVIRVALVNMVSSEMTKTIVCVKNETLAVSPITLDFVFVETKYFDNFQIYSSLDNDPCEGMPHKIWLRCTVDAGPKCYIDSRRNRCYVNLISRCVCRPGYARNLEQRCIKITSPQCKALANVDIRKVIIENRKNNITMGDAPL